MRSIEPSSGGSPEGLIQQVDETQPVSLSLPFGRPVSFSSIGGPTYVTAQTLVQHLAYALSDKLFTYSPDTFDLDIAVKQWSSQSELNANGYPTTVLAMETRQGAGAIALGYIFSKDFDLRKRHIPQSILASSATLQYMRPALEQLSLLYSIASPLVAHVSAADYIGGPSAGLVSDYSTALGLAEELGMALVASQSAHESQHMALLSTLLATYLPTIHIYDGLRVGRETTRVIDILSQVRLHKAYKSVLGGLSESQKHLDMQGKLLNLLKTFNVELGTEYEPFEYHGHPEATSVLVTFGTVESSLAKSVAIALAKESVRIGVVNVRIYRPFVEEEFIKVLPKTTRIVGVLGQVQNELAVQEPGVHAPLYEDVLAALTFSSKIYAHPDCLDIKYSPSSTWDITNITAAFQKIVKHPNLEAGEPGMAQTSRSLHPSVQQYTFWDVDNSFSSGATLLLSQVLAKDSTFNVSTNVVYDNLVQGGVIRTDIRRSPKIIDAPYPIDSADVSYVGNLKLLSEVQVLASVKDGGRIILNCPGVEHESLKKKLPAAFKTALVHKGIELFILNTSNSQVPSLESLILQFGFLRAAFPDLELVGVKKMAHLLGNDGKVENVSENVESMLRKIETHGWKVVEEVASESEQLSIDIRGTSFAPFSKTEPEPSPKLEDWQTVAKSLAFKESYGTKHALRPDLPTKTFTVTVQENRRLTPVTYNRNIFHIEFDLGDSGLKYDIGEALGIHAENNREHVNDFIKFYNLSPDEVVQVPSREDPKVLESRTIYQALTYNIDIFGKPPKRFYESLADFATDTKEKHQLLKLGGADGADEFKQRSEIDTVTYADILQEFPSAHPSFHNLIKIVNPMKRREYSIASCQKVTPNSVALMIVVVDWIDPRGRTRYGQASYYLSKLKPGATVTVSVKPSVMKLPPKSTQPIIMAGLGTGLAPFRAFVQHRALEKAQGKDIGSVLLYMGSRHQREEYCYGEEWEAYQAAGVITLLGRAFSRDQHHKIYIQDRMRETLPEITQAYLQEEGAFYLCGPTWPVPDVTNVLEEAIVLNAKANGKKVDTRKEIEKLKDDLRYVLEVY
ncbi:sulfite reductase [NADPH] flavoprotein component [Emydomyces testavorans]|uniref:assimilatory sulfite reductase (NADPH) n=1 Tax=Emydomyces testavorans TaxID=2070801 RepID=A0AAF0IIU0_9EURO|nr:sulfite reductase [NADPH] flavoprotein component [Emydomyces testavorans]